MRAAALLAREARDEHAGGELEQEPELERLRQVVVEDLALVVDDDALVALTEVADDPPCSCICFSRRKTPKFSCIVFASSSRICQAARRLAGRAAP